MMNIEEYVDGVLSRGLKQGLPSLAPLERKLFLVSQAEVLCDMEGIDTFLDSYAPAEVLECASAFRAIGATQIADLLDRISRASPPGEADLSQVNTLITDRTQYDYDAIEAWLAAERESNQISELTS